MTCDLCNVIVGYYQPRPQTPEAAEDPIDIYRQVAAKVLDISPEDVTDNQRDFGKRVAFASVYSGIDGLHVGDWGVFDESAREYIDMTEPAARAFVKYDALRFTLHREVNGIWHAVPSES